MLTCVCVDVEAHYDKVIVFNYGLKKCNIKEGHRNGINISEASYYLYMAQDVVPFGFKAIHLGD